MMAKVAESLMTVVSIPEAASDFAMRWPPKCGAPSQTMTWNFRVFAAAFRNCKGWVRDCVCESVCARMLSSIVLM